MKRWEGRVGAERLRRIVVAGGAAALVLVGAGAADATDGGSAAPVPQCSDGLDNDGDGWIDHYEDPDCAGAEDDDEGPPAEGAALLGGGDTLLGGAATSPLVLAPVDEPQTYYQQVVGDASAAALASAEPGLPSTLAIEDATATARYLRLSERGWQVRIEGFRRNHERVDAIYDMVLVLPLPAAADGRDGFTTRERGVRIEEGPAGRSVPLVYGGEKVVLKRNVGLEKSLLPRLVGNGAGSLPSLDGTGYRWTAWDTVVTRDAGFGDVVQARAELGYETAADAPAPDPDDPRFAAYVITWIPALPAHVPPYAVRIDVAAVH